MAITIIALSTALFSGYLVLTGLPGVVRDTARLVAGTLGARDGRASGLAFAALWLMIFSLGMA
ncbi:hypothetical protein [Citreimonas sp.]|uniref:hypothetical protein n=1 Tax=Citreimonas sp. TaxID=3036715 RepID=UPI0035C87AAC